MTNLLLWNCFRNPLKLSWNNGLNSTRKFSAFFKVRGLWESLLFLPRWNMIRVNFFCCLARECNYCDENLRDVNFKSGLYCRRENIVFKAPGRFWSFRNFMYAITSHKKQRAKYQREMLSHIAKTAILFKRSNYKVKLPAKKKILRLLTPIINCDNADGHSQTPGVVNR